MHNTAFTFVSLGVAAENKSIDSWELNVLPTETQSAFDGEVRVNPLELRANAVDGSGNPQQYKMLTDTVLTAEWYALDTNRTTAPDIRRGEEVEIWQLGDSDKYYWKSRNNRLGQRTLETSVHAWAASPELTDNKRNALNSYYFEVSTHRKSITLSTSQKNGEPFGYTFQFNTKDGRVVLRDQTGNTIYLDSKERVIRALNSTGSEIAINDKDIYMKSVRDMKIDVGRDLEVNVGRNEKRVVGKQRQTVIGTDEERKVGKNEQVAIGANRKHSVTGTHTETVTGSFTGTYNTTYAANVATAYSLTASTALTMQTQVWTVTAASGAFTIPLLGQTGVYTAIDAVISGKRFSSHYHGNGNNGAPTDKPIG